MSRKKALMFPRLLLLLVLLRAVALGEQQVVYCEDPAIADWAKRAERLPNDSAIQTLHALWLGLCAKVRDGSIDTQLAIELFQRARQVARRFMEEQAAKPVVGL
jgi:hypothetical protein